MPKRQRGQEDQGPGNGRDMADGIKHPHHEGADDAWVESAFASRYTSQPIPKTKLNDEPMPAPVAYQLIRDMRQLDSNPRLNLASFVTTWMEPEAAKLIKEASDVNFVDAMQYPSCTEMQNRCVAMLADLYHAPDEPGVGTAKGTGTATVGSSEAIMLAGLAMKRRWAARRKAAGLPTDKPNLIMGYNVQVCWEKFTRYFEVEERFVALEEGTYVLTPEKAIALADENTIGICGILGSTYTGEFEDIAGLDKAVTKLNKDKGWHIPIHVDAASGGFVAPFVDPDLKWDFRLKNVASINVSGHKYGLVYPGVGWVIWRSKEFLPEDLVFHTNYLGSDQPSFTLNFSRSACQIVAQYYQFLRLGFGGYRKIMANLRNVAKRLADGILATGHFTLLSNDHSVPLVAFSLKPNKGGKEDADARVYDEFDLADRLRQHGWTLPAYTMAPNAQHVKLLRAVVREDLSMGMADSLVEAIKLETEWLDHHYIFSEEKYHELQEKFAPHRHAARKAHKHGKKHQVAVC